MKATLRSPGLLIFLLCACSHGGGGGGAPPTTAGRYTLHVGDSSGVRAVEATGIQLADDGTTLGVVVFDHQKAPPADVTATASFRIVDPGVATFREGGLVGLGAGTTVLEVTVGADILTVSLAVRPADQCDILEFWLDPVDEMVQHDLSPTSVRAIGRLACGGIRDVSDRLTWRTVDPSVCTVDAQGAVRAVGDGRTHLVARDPSGAEHALVLFVALPRQSGTIVDNDGAYVANGRTAAWVPPDTLLSPVRVDIAEVAGGALPGPLPPGASLLGAVRLDVAGTAAPASGIVMSLAAGTVSRGAVAARELGQVLLWNPLQQSWQHFAWVTPNELGELQWVTQLPQIFAVVASPGAAAAFAAAMAPALAVADTDVVPIGFDHFLSGVDLYLHNTLLPDARVMAHPSAADLAAHDDSDHYLFLDDDDLATFQGRSSWAASRLGGITRRSEGIFRPMVQWSVKTAQRHELHDGTGTANYVVVQYWFLYAASGQPFGLGRNGYDLCHHGDLEFAQVLLDGREETPTPIGATASQHFYGEGRHWRDTQRDGDRLLLFVAKGSHATYFERGFAGGNTYGSTWGSEGFLAKDDVVPFTEDFCPTVAEQVTLRPFSDYDLRQVEDGSESGTMLLGWHGTIDKDHTFCEALPMIGRRSPKVAALAMYAHGLDFHAAYAFSTQTGIDAYEAIAPRDLAARLAIGHRMFDLQRLSAETFPTGTVQSHIDTACGPQPEHLSQYLVADRHYPPARYYACDEWRLTAVTPREPRQGVVGAPFELTVSWSGVLQAGVGQIAYPLQITVLPAVEQGGATQQQGEYPGPSGTTTFTVSTGLQIVSAPAGTTAVTVPIEWQYSEGGVPMSIPTAACQAGLHEMRWRFNLFVRDANGTRLYHTSTSLVAFGILPDGPAIDITTTLCRGTPL